MRAQLIEALQEHAKGHIAKHKANVEVLLEKINGIAEHIDFVDTADKKTAKLAEAKDKLDAIKNL